MVAFQKINIFTTVIFVTTPNICQAWTAYSASQLTKVPSLPSTCHVVNTVSKVSESSSSTALNAASSALYYRRDDDVTSLYAVSSDATYATSNNAQSATDAQSGGYGDSDMENQLESALAYARDMDRKYGLCTPASTRAWQVVDELYLASSAARKVEDTVKKVLGAEKSVWSLHERA